MAEKKRPAVLGLRLKPEHYDQLDKVLEYLYVKRIGSVKGLGRRRYKWVYTYQDAIVYLITNGSLLEVIQD